MSLPWLRLYTEFASDPKIQIMAFEDQRHYVMVLCLKGNGVLDSECPSDAYRERLIAKALGLDPVSSADAKRRLIEGGLLREDWQPVSWDKRQFESDSSAARVRKHREKRKGNVTETLPKRRLNAIDQNRTDADKKPLTALPNDWRPEPQTLVDLAMRWTPQGLDVERELERFRNRNSGVLQRDWLATFRNWLIKAKEYHDRDAPRQPAVSGSTMMLGGKLVPLT